MAMSLRRNLGFFDAYAIGVGAIIGAGIFVILGVATKEAGPSLIISVLISAVISMFTALSFAELAEKIPKEGGGYEFAHEVISPFAGFLTGWMWLISNIITGAAVAIGFAQYLALVVPVPSNIIAAISCLGVTALNYYGVRESSRANDVLVVFKIFVLLFFSGIGLFLIHPQNFVPFAPDGTMGIMTGAALIFFAFAGFGRVAMLSEEVKDPVRTVPRAILASLGTATVLYILVGIVAIGLIGAGDLGLSSSPLVDAGAAISPTMAQLLGLAAIAATLSVLITTLLGISRITFAMSRNGDMIRRLGEIHPHRGTPYMAILVFGGLMTVMAFFSDLLFAAAVSNFASLVYYALVNASAIKMNGAHYPRTIPIIGLLSCILLMPFLGYYAIILGILSIIIVSAVYYLDRRLNKRIVGDGHPISPKIGK